MRTARWFILALVAAAAPLWADPCGLVPPVYVRQNPERFLTRKGDQITFVFFKNGIQDVVLRPAFEGKVDEFGMLIPFASVPAIRKVSDDVFAQVADAVEPPKVTIDLMPVRALASSFDARGAESITAEAGLKYQGVKVLKKEAVGMYQVAVLEAGSAAALKRWMTTHGYVYPEGMDRPVNEYVAKRWCFVAVKARVGKKKGVEPRPGLKKTDPKLPDGATFSGAVQAMGFRFRVKEPVVPMRLSAYNPGKLHNIVYALTDKAVRFKELPETFVKKQIPGKELLANLTEPLPANFIYWGDRKRETVSLERGEKPGKRLEKFVAMLRLNGQGWDVRRDPAPHNGKAKDLFAANLLAAKLGRLSHEFEEKQKDFLNVGEEFKLRGPEVDALIHAEMEKWRKEELGDVIDGLKDMTLTVIEGDFPREVLREKDLTLMAYAAPKVEKKGMMDFRFMVLLGAMALLIAVAARWKRARRFAGAAVFLAAGALALQAQEPRELVAKLSDRAARDAAMELLVKGGEKSVQALLEAAREKGRDAMVRGWAIVCLSRIGSQGQETLEGVLSNQTEGPMVRLWCAGAIAEHDPQSALDALLKGMGRGWFSDQLTPWSQGLLYKAVSHYVGNTLGPREPDALIRACLRGSDNRVRRLAAGFLGSRELDSDDVRAAFVKAVAYGKEVPWKGGALFIPGVAWKDGQARDLFAALIRWKIHFEKTNDAGNTQVMLNNLAALAPRQRMVRNRSNVWKWNGGAWAVAWTDKWGVPQGLTLQAGELLVAAWEAGQVNVGVLIALQKLSGKNFQSDTRKWRAWLDGLRKENDI